MLRQFFFTNLLQAFSIQVESFVYGFRPGLLPASVQNDPQFFLSEIDLSQSGQVGDHLLKCSMVCGADITCGIFILHGSVCDLYQSMTIATDSGNSQLMQAHFKVNALGLGPSQEILIFRQDITDKVLWPMNVTSMNPNDPQNLKYSILDQVDNFKRQDGSFHFKLCYPELWNNSLCFRWSQSENPLKIFGQAVPQGFVYKGGPPNKQTGFSGLSRSSPHLSLLDGDISSPNAWWFTVGAHRGFGANQDTFPGPKVDLVKRVELYIET